MKKLMFGLVIVMLAWSVSAYGETKTSLTVNIDDREYVGLTLQGLGTENEVGLVGKVGTFRPNDDNVIMTYYGFGANKRVIGGAFVGVYSAFLSYESNIRGGLGVELTWAIALKDQDVNGLIFSIAYDELVQTSIGIGAYW